MEIDIDLQKTKRIDFYFAMMMNYKCGHGLDCRQIVHSLTYNIFGDLIKKETGKTAKEYIQTKIIDVAKNKIFNPDTNITEIAYALGFKYPQHFTRMFKSETGYTPSEFRVLN